MALPELTPQLVLLEEAVTILFCRVDDVTGVPRSMEFSEIEPFSLASEVSPTSLPHRTPGVW